MGKRRDWSKIGEVVEKIRELGLSYKEGSERFGVKLRDLYDYNRWLKREGSGVNGNGQQTETSGGGEAETGPKDRGSQLPEEVKELIRSYRRDRPTQGFKRIADLLKEKHLVVVTRKQIR